MVMIGYGGSVNRFLVGAGWFDNDIIRTVNVYVFGCFDGQDN